MDIKAVHERFKDDQSPSVEGQIRWLQKQGFAEHQIQQAMITVYSDIERGETPVIYSREVVTPDGKSSFEKLYHLASDAGPGGEKYEKNQIQNGWDLDQVLLAVAKRYRTEDLNAMLKNMEKFESNMREKWVKEQELKNARPGFFKRLFSRKPAEVVEE